MVAGDSPSSGRLFEAIDSGSPPAVVAPQLIENLSPLVPWSSFLLDGATSHCFGRGMHAHCSVPGMAQKS